MNPVLMHREGLRVDSFDKEGNPDLRTIFTLFQKAATRHAEELGIGKDFYERNGLLYVLCRMKLVFQGRFEKGKEYTLVTYALPPEKIQFVRDAYIEEEEGKRIALLKTTWVLISATRRRIVLTDGLVQRLSPLKEELQTLVPVFEERLSALEESPAQPLFVHRVGKEDIDANNHMNNTVYIHLTQEAGFDGLVKTFEIDFEKECLLGEDLTIYKGKDGYFCGFKNDSLSYKAKATYFR